MTGWTGQAHLLADDIREPGFACAAACAAAWSARVDPAAVRGLVGAAMTLTSSDAGASLWAAADPYPDDKALLDAAAELEGWTADLLRRATQLARDCRAALEAAHVRLAAAGAAIAAAQAQLASAVTGRQAAAAQDAIAAAEAERAAAMAEIADCEAALEIIDDAGRRLAHAANCLRKVPDDLAGTYETPYQHVRDGGMLPHDGEFLTGGISHEAA